MSQNLGHLYGKQLINYLPKAIDSAYSENEELTLIVQQILTSNRQFMSVPSVKLFSQN